MILATASPASVVLTVAAALAYAVPAAAASRLSERAARTALLAAWMLHAVVLAAGLLGTPPRFGFAPALLVTAWLVLTVYAVERQLFPHLQARWALAGLGSAIGVGLVGMKASEAVGRNPGAATKILVQSILAIAFAEAIVFYALFLVKG